MVHFRGLSRLLAFSCWPLAAGFELPAAPVRPNDLTFDGRHWLLAVGHWQFLINPKF